MITKDKGLKFHIAEIVCNSIIKHSVSEEKGNILEGDSRHKNKKQMLYKHRSGNAFISSYGQVTI